MIDQDKLNALSVAATNLFATGTEAQRDALRYVANTVLSESAALSYEDLQPTLDTAYRVLGSSLDFSGDGRLLLPEDDVVSFDSLLDKKKGKHFMSAVRNMALTLYKTDPRTKNLDWWPEKSESLASILMDAFIWMNMQEGLRNVLANDELVSHTRLPQIIITVQKEGKSDDYAGAYRWSLFAANDGYESSVVKNSFASGHMAALEERWNAKHPVPPTDVSKMKYDDLYELCHNEKLIPPVDEDDDEDEYDHEDLSRVYYEKHGWPFDVESVDDAEWHTGGSIASVAVSLPRVSLTPPPAPNHIKKSRAKTAGVCKTEMIDLHPDRTVWHTIDASGKPGDSITGTKFSITLVSRHTCGVTIPVATQVEALAVANALFIAENSK